MSGIALVRVNKHTWGIPLFPERNYLSLRGWYSVHHSGILPKRISDQRQAAIQMIFPTRWFHLQYLQGCILYLHSSKLWSGSCLQGSWCQNFLSCIPLQGWRAGSNLRPTWNLRMAWSFSGPERLSCEFLHLELMRMYRSLTSKPWQIIVVQNYPAMINNPVMPVMKRYDKCQERSFLLNTLIESQSGISIHNSIIPEVNNTPVPLPKKSL